MEQLREDTFRYTNVEDPVEAAARMQRVLHSEEVNLMEETATRIIDAAIQNLRIHEKHNGTLTEADDGSVSSPHVPLQRAEINTPRSTRRTRDKTSPSRRTNASPRIFAGTNLRKINIAQTPSRHGFPHTAPIHSSQRRSQQLVRTNHASAVAPSSTNQGRKSSDFHTHPPPLP